MHTNEESKMQVGHMYPRLCDFPLPFLLGCCGGGNQPRRAGAAIGIRRTHTWAATRSAVPVGLAPEGDRLCSVKLQSDAYGSLPGQKGEMLPQPTYLGVKLVSV